jgi:HK97 family phage major capsid protein
MPTGTAFPDRPEQLAEALKDPKWVAENFSTPKAIAKSMNDFKNAWDKTPDAKVIAAQVGEQLDATFTEKAKEWGLAKDRPTTTGLTDLKHADVLRAKGTGAIRNAAHNPNLHAASLDGVFTGLGELAQTMNVQNIASGGRLHRDKLAKLQEVRAAYSSFDPASAGFLIPEEFRSEIMRLVLEQSVIRPRATVITMGTQRVSIPFVDETTHVGSVFGGMLFAWTAEAGTIASSEAKFGRVTLEANKLTGGARIPNELMNDAPALSSFLNNAAPSGLAFAEDQAFLTGDGGMQPLGLLNSPAAVSVSKETGQGAATILVDNIVKMYSRMIPSSLNSAVWLVNQACLPQLLTLSIAVGTGGAPVNMVNINSAPDMTLLGRPIIVTEKIPTVGTVGDIIFADLSYYLVGDRQAVSVESSEHSRFMSDETEIRIIERVDGRPWIQSALTPVAGNTLSPFVTLATRA